jgi:uncharacterized protein YqeY
VRQIKSTVDTEESRKGAEFDDQAIEEVITRLARQHRESIEVFRQQDRAELADKEEAELEAKEYKDDNQDLVSHSPNLAVIRSFFRLDIVDSGAGTR